MTKTGKIYTSTAVVFRILSEKQNLFCGYVCIRVCVYSGPCAYRYACM